MSSGRFIFIVEDSGQLAMILSSQLRRMEIASELHGSLPSLRRRLQGRPQRPDAVITDFNLAGPETGIDVVDFVRAAYPHHTPPVILFTGSLQRARRAAEERGEQLRDLFAATVEKGEDAAALLARLREALEAAIATPSATESE